MRFSSGITRRANSVLSTSMPRDHAEISAAVDEVERRSAERWLAPTFQVWQPASGTWLSSAAVPGPDGTAGENDDFLEGQQRLADLLERRGYESVAPTRVLWLGREDIPQHTAWDPRVGISETLSDAWLDAHMGTSADAIDPASRMVYRRLLAGGSSRFFDYPDQDGAMAAIAKLSIVHERPERSFGGVYAMKVRKDLRGRGMVGPIIDAIFHHAVRMGLEGIWMQVEERSEKALALAADLGFTTAARYRYLTRPA
ncbi:GNAT family N-acetyltransferase [Citricoccus sp. CH26A]|uniref:GNAT family N-acetyltransferase n=1 Tax=Citricoccus sp. CH26A TaxID=1045009 RepID=UPI000255EBB0|nr:GNAT family N-acetyltransferase [Citricoccus sp. CH26A]